MFDFLLLQGIGLLFVEGFMILLWMMYLIQKNVSLVDIGWGLSFIMMALVAFIGGDGYVWRRALILTIVSIWALRLVWHLMQRFHPNQDDPRYEKVLQSQLLPGPLNLKVLALYLIQGFLVALLSLHFMLMSQNILPFFSAPEVFGLLIWMVGLVGEAVADRQLACFKQQPVHSMLVCKEGLWRYSRHPNYFFEWIIWIGYFVMALSSPFGWLAIISPILILYLLLKVSGIPPAEAQALETQGSAYQAYQEETSSFFPWFPKKSAEPPAEEK